MKIRPLFGGKERETLDVLDRVLRGTAFRAFGQVRLAEVLEPESGDDVRDQTFLRMSHFDFVVCDRRRMLLPVFAVEFDGPFHELPQQERRDIRKNRLCATAGLPLLRIGDATLERYKQLSVLEFMLQRFVVWQREHGAIQEWIDDSLPRLSAEEIERMVEEVRLRRDDDPILSFLEGDALTNSADPSFWFNLQHKFPGLQVVARRLLAKF